MNVEAVLAVAAALGLPPRAAYPARTAARILGIGRSSVYEAIHAGRIAVVRVGRVLYIPVYELARVLAEGGLQGENPRAGTRG